jgi:formylglycine-generating enzyme
MKTASLVLLFIPVWSLPMEAQDGTFTNSIGMEFVLIQPGTMRVGVFQPSCPDPNAPAVSPAAFFGARSSDSGSMSGGSGAGQGRTVGSGSGSTAQDPRVSWSDADYKKCQELLKQDSSPGFDVGIEKPYYIGKFEVTQAQWKKVMDKNPSVFQGSKVSDDADRHPVDNVTWQDAQAFVKKLNRMEKTKAYRLPTEFEWEYAGRAGGPGQVDWTAIREMAVQGVSGFGLAAAQGGAAAPSSYPPTTQTVGTKKPNPWGLYDMLGNVWEWVQDPYNEKSFADPVPAKKGKEHVLKGCGFLSDVKNCIYATHGAGPADGWDVGFRVVKEAQ